MTKDNKFRALIGAFIVVYALLLLTPFITAKIRGCHGQCGHGDKHCQERCFAKGECPMEAQ